ncbi:MAG TPA: hypothetical protein PLA97_17960 [Rubrivivax sp.]|nr:hypothetical protein [Rubrivivax sp.]
MRLFPIHQAGYHGRHIKVDRYATSANGVEISISHNLPNVAGSQFQWVQTVSSNGGFSVDCKMLTRVDPFGHGSPSLHKVSLPAVPGLCKADDLLPFYWTAADLAGGAGPGLKDAPQGPFPAKGRIWTQFVTALTKVTGSNVHHLVAIAWGYDRMADNTVRVAAIRIPSRAEMINHGQALKRMYPAYRYT